MGVVAAAMMATLSVIGAIQQQEATAAKSGVTNYYCYSVSGFDFPACYPNKGECNKAQSSDPFATSGCFKRTFDATP